MMMKTFSWRAGKTLFSIALLIFPLLTQAQTLTEVFLPRYMFGNGIVGSNLVPYVFRARISGLQPGTRYFYNNLAVREADNKAANGGGTSIAVKASGLFMHNDVGYQFGSFWGDFVADANGEYENWFILQGAVTQLTNNARVFMQINLSQSEGVGAPSVRLYTTNTVQVMNYTGVSALRSTPATGAAPKNFVLLYDTESPAPGTRPVSAALVENDEYTHLPTGRLGYASFLRAEVDGVNGAWGTIIPNTLPDGIRKIVRYTLDGKEAGFNTSADGVWPAAGGGTINTAGISGGNTTANVLDGSLVTLSAGGTQPQSITFPELPLKTYKDADAPAGAIASSGLPVTYVSSDPAVAVVVNGMLQVIGAGTANITAIQEGNASFAPATPVVKTVTVNKASLHIRANSISRYYANSNPELTVTYIGFRGGDNVSKLRSRPDPKTIANVNSLPGEYAITLAPMPPETSDAYDITVEDGILTVLPLLTQSISFGAIAAKKYGDADFSLGASSSSGLPVSYTSSNQAVATVRGSTIHITGVGTTTITALQAGGISFSAAAPVAQTLTVDKGKITIRANDAERYVYETNPPFTLTYEGLAAGENESVFNPAPVTTTGASSLSLPGEYPIIVSGAATTNYDIVYVAGKLTITDNDIINTDKIYAYCDAPGRLKVTLYLYSSEKLSIDLYDMAGKRRAGIQTATVKGYNTFFIDVNSLSAGMYPVVVSGGRILLKSKAVILK